MADILCAGHICLDLIPTLPGPFTFEPGQLVEVGGVAVSTGGSVSNTGLALHRLGAEVEFCGKLGDDAFGRLALDVLNREGIGKPVGLTSGAQTSYTVVLNPPGQDRMFLHNPGANAEFGSDDVTDEALNGAKILHLGYPPLLKRMYRDNGDEVRRLFARAHGFGTLTSLDMTYPDPESESGKIDWERWLTNVLPETDLFVPSAPELAFMLGTSNHASGSLEALDWDARRALQLGASVVLLKNGESGLYVSTSPELGHGLFPSTWKAQRHFEPSFQVQVAGTTGAGDATVAGFLLSLLKGLCLQDAARVAAAVGACSVEAPDAVSGIPGWEGLQARLGNHWAKN